MARIFISHSSEDNAEALALHQWLSSEGWGAEDDLFLDIHPSGGIAAGERWLAALQEAASRCEAVLFLISEAWLASRWCLDEYHLASSYHKKLFALLIEDIPLSRLPGGLASQWQVVRLDRRPARRFVVVLPTADRDDIVYFAERELVRLHQGLVKAGVGPETFTLQPDPEGPFGWRSPYRGLEALQSADAAVFFGREADTVRALDALRGLAERPDGHLLVILGASGAGKSSFLRAGLVPRLVRDDAAWLAAPPLRAGSEGALEGPEGLLAALAEVRRRFGLPVDHASLRPVLDHREAFLAELGTLRGAAADRALLDPGTPRPRVVWSLDQAEELFTADADPDGAVLLTRLRDSVASGDAVILATIRSDSYARMQHSEAFEGLRQDTFSLLPVPSGEVARIIRAPAQVLRARVGPDAPVFAPEVVASLQGEMAGEEDALPLLALAMQRLMREYADTTEIGPEALEVTGGVARAIEEAAEAALREAGPPSDPEARRALVRRTFVPRLARVDRESKAFERRVVRESELVDPDVRGLIEAFVARRLVVRKRSEADPTAATIEVAHEALLRRWPLLVGLLEADREGLVLLDGVLEAAEEWQTAPDARRDDFLAHRGSRLDDAIALGDRGPEWQRELDPARDYLKAARTADDAQREQQRRDFARRRRLQGALISVLSIVLVGVLGLGAWLVRQTREVNRERSEVLAAAAEAQVRDRAFDSALRLAITAASSRSWLSPVADRAGSVLARAAFHDRLRVAGSTEESVRGAIAFEDESRLLTFGPSPVAELWEVRSGTLIRRFEHPANVITARLFGDDSRLLTSAEDRVVRVWDLATGRELSAMAHPDPLGLRVRFDETNRRVVLWGQSGPLVRVFDVDTGQPLGVFEHDGEVRRARLLDGGRTLVTVTEPPAGSQGEAVLHRWDLPSGERAVREPLGVRAVRRMTLRDDALFLHGEGVLQVRDALTGALRVTIPLPSRRDATLLAQPARAVVLGDDRQHTIFDLVTGEPTATFETSGRARWCETAPGARLLVAVDLTRPESGAFRRSRLEVFSAETGARTHAFDHESPVEGIRMLEDGTRALTWTKGTTAHLWSLDTGRQEARFEADDRIGTPLLSADERTLFVASDARVLLWDVSGRPIGALDHDREVIQALPLAGDARLLTLTAPGASSTWRVWHLDDLVRTVSRTLSEDGVRSSIDEVMRLPGGRYLIASGGPGTTGFLDLRADRWLDAPDLAGALPVAVLDRPARALFRGPSALTIVQPDTGATTAQLDGDGHILWHALVDDGARLVTLRGPERVDPGDGVPGTALTARVHDTATGEVLQEWTHPADVPAGGWDGEVRAVLAEDGRAAAIAVGQGPVVVVDLATATEQVRLDHPGLLGLAASPDLDVLVTWSGGSELRIWDGRTAELRHQAELPGELVDARIAPGASRLAAWTRDVGGEGILHLWELETPAPLATVHHGTEVRGVDFFADGALGLSWSGRRRPQPYGEDDRGWVATWRLDDGSLVARFDHGAGVVAATRFADDQRLLTASADHTARVWDLATGVEWMRVTHDAAVSGATLFADDTRLLTWSRDNTARVWDVASGAEILTVFHPSVTGAALVDDEARLATWGGDGELRLVPLQGVAPVPRDALPGVVRRLCETRLVGRIDGIPRSQVQVEDRRAAALPERRTAADVCSGASGAAGQNRK